METHGPIPAPPQTLLLREARDSFLAARGFTVEDYTAFTFTIRFGKLPVKLLNTEARKRAVPLHDLHHILTGYATSWIGEAEIGAWELRAGCNSFILYWLNGWGVIFGLFISPGRVWRAFRRAKGQRTLYRDSISYDSFLQMTVGEARSRLGLPPQGCA